MNYKVNKKEPVLFIVKIFLTAFVLYGLYKYIAFLAAKAGQAGAMMAIFAVYAVFIWLFFFFQKVFLVAYMKGNGVCVSARQFPEIYAAYQEMAAKLNLKKVPKLFILQQGGMLNAFAIRFSCRNYIAIYSDIFSVYESDLNAVKFVLGHELGHVQRKHLSKNFWTFPSAIIPFVSKAYSRACEFTCDNIGGGLIDSDRQNGIVLLAGGKDLYKKIDIDNYLEEAEQNRSFAVKFVGLTMTHPYLPKRIVNLRALDAK